MELCKKKEKNVSEEIKDFPDYETGSTYIYLDIKRETNLFVAFSVGKWTQTTCNEFYELIAKRTQQPTYKQKIIFCTDCNKQNLPAITKTFHQDSVQYGQVVKEKEGQIVIGTHPRQVLGAMPFSKISIAHVDGLCSKLRARTGFFVRKTRNFAKRRKLIPNVLQVWQLNHNVIEAEKGETPAMREGLTTKKWNWNDIFMVRLSFII